MAKMFYTLDEAAAKLGIAPDQLREMAEQRKVQQFRDRDKLMFKCQEIDELLAMKSTQQVNPGELTIEAEDDIRLTDDVTNRSSKTDSIDLMSESPAAKPASSRESLKSRTATGISVFDADEVETADPMAQTQVTSGFVGDDDDLSLDSVGSGSGLLDLTRESDDTSLGAVELLEDVGGEASDAKMGGGSGLGSLPASSTGIFDVGAAEAGSTSGLVNLGDTQEVATYYVEESPDPAGDGLGGGMMLGVFITLLIGSIIVLAALQGQVIELTRFFVFDTNTNALDSGRLGIWAGVLAVVTLILGGIGWYVGNMRAKKAAVSA